MRVERTPAVHHNLLIVASVANNGIDICRIAIEQDHNGGYLNALVRRSNRRKEVACFPKRSLHCTHVMGDDAHTLSVKRPYQSERRRFDHVWRSVVV